MRYALMGLVAMAGVACARQIPIFESAPGRVMPIESAPSDAEMTAAYSGALDNRVRISFVDAYAEGIKMRVHTGGLATAELLSRETTYLWPGAFADVTDEEFERMETFRDGPDLKRIRMIVAPPSSESVEYYYHDTKLVMVLYDPNGANKTDPHPDTESQRFYFGEEGLIAWTLPDGTSISPLNPDFGYWSRQLLAEAERFAAGTN